MTSSLRDVSLSGAAFLAVKDAAALRQAAQYGQRCPTPKRLDAVQMQLPERELPKWVLQRDLQRELQQEPHFALAKRALMQTAAARRYWQMLWEPRD